MANLGFGGVAGLRGGNYGQWNGLDANRQPMATIMPVTGNNGMDAAKAAVMPTTPSVGFGGTAALTGQTSPTKTDVGALLANAPAQNLGLGARGIYKYQKGNTNYDAEYNQGADAITQQVNRNLQEQILPGINGAAQMAGQYGGSRQAIVQALANSRANGDIASGLASLRSNIANRQSQENIAKLQMATAQQNAAANAENMGRTLDLREQEMLMNNALQMRGQDINQNQFAANYGLQSGNAIQNWMNNAQNNNWSGLNNYSNIINGMRGNTTNTTTGQGQSPWATALGGALAGSQIYGNLFGS